MRNNPYSGPAAVKNLALLPQARNILLDEIPRKQEAAEARKEIDAKKREAGQALDQAIRVLAARGYLLETELTDLIQRHKAGFKEAEVRARVRVRVLSAARERPEPKPVLDSSLFDRMTSCLILLNKKDLYDFLGMPPGTNCATLLERSRELDKAIRDINTKTPEVTEQAKAAGFCLDVFGSDSQRRRYDNTLGEQGWRSVEPLLLQAGQAEKGLKAENVDELIKLARERGIGTDEAIARILDYARGKGWSVVLPKQTAAERLQACGNCGVLNGEKETVCGPCGSPLKITCPKCQTVNASERRACSKCGFTVGDRFLVEALAARRRVGPGPR